MLVLVPHLRLIACLGVRAQLLLETWTQSRGCYKQGQQSTSSIWKGTPLSSTRVEPVQWTVQRLSTTTRRYALHTSCNLKHHNKPPRLHCIR